MLPQHNPCKLSSGACVHLCCICARHPPRPKKEKYTKMQRVCWELQTYQGHMQMSEKSGFVMHSYNRQTNLSAPTHHSCGHLFVFCWEQLPPADKRYQDFHLWSSRWLILSVYGSESSAFCFNWVVFWSGWVTGVKNNVRAIITRHSFLCNAQSDLPAMSQ